MNYQETVEFLFSQLPQFQKEGQKAHTGKLDNIVAMCEILGNPQDQIKTIHIAGTNGKGSCGHMIASVLIESGYKVGIYSSPHLIDFRERIRINGEMIAQEDVCTFVESHWDAFKPLQPSFFEWTTALAFKAFKKAEVDVAIIEVGLGGRLDSTNIITPLLSVITSIGIDHIGFLGDTIEQIAFEKAGIIKPNVPFVTGMLPKEAEKVIKDIGLKRNAPKAISSSVKNYESDLKGKFQQDNIKTAVSATEQLKEHFDIKEEQIISGLKSVCHNTNFGGRWQQVATAPKTIVDIGHNTDAIESMKASLEKESYHHLHVVFGMVEDKEVEKVVKLLPEDATYYLCTPKIPRGLEKNILQKFFAKQITTSTFESANHSYTAALENAGSDDLILITGSTFIVSEILRDFFQN